MTKIRKPRLKIMRRVGGDLGLMSGIRALDTKGKISTRPGMHGAKRMRTTVHGDNLRKKQYIRYTYGILDKQLFNYHQEAIRQMRALRRKGQEAEYPLLILLESRLDVTVYRLGFASTIAAARQLVVHKKIHVNGKRQSKPGLLLKANSVIEVKVKDSQKGIIEEVLDFSEKHAKVHEWLNVEKSSLKGTFIRPPQRDELPSDLINKESEVIQFYSK